MMKKNGMDIKGKTVVISGAGNVAIYATEKAQQLGAKVVTMSDSTGWIYDAEGIDLAAVKEIKEVKRARLTEYKKYRPNSEYHEGKGVWTVPVRRGSAVRNAERAERRRREDARQERRTGCCRGREYAVHH